LVSEVRKRTWMALTLLQPQSHGL